MNSTVLILPGWQDSGPLHWQTLWEQQNSSFKRVQQKDWENPERNDWLRRIHEEVSRAVAPVVFAAHSLGCIAVAHWCQLNSADVGKIRGALLAAPADIERSDAPEPIRNFAPIPRQPFPFSTIVVSSSDDPYLTMDRAQEFAQAWGSRFVDIGPAGHINSGSGLGDWPEGKRMLRQLME
jgi:serine hydrolase